MRRLPAGLVRWSRLLEGEQARVLAWAVLAGLVGGLAAAGVDWLVVVCGQLLLGTTDPHLAAADGWALVAPILAGGLATALLSLPLGEGRSRLTTQGIPEVIAAMATRRTSIGLRRGLFSVLSAALVIGAGHPAGREGPIVQLGAAAMDALRRQVGLPASHARALVAAGAAAGLAASFRSPLAGAFFAMEVLLGTIALEAFAPAVVAAVVGAVVGEALLGDRVALRVPPFPAIGFRELLIYPGLGLACALVAGAFQALQRRVNRFFQPIPLNFRPLAAGVLVAPLVFAAPEVRGNAYGFLRELITAPDLGWSLGLVLVLQGVATTLTVAGRSGAGQFAPAMVLGAITGALVGSLGQWLWPVLVPSVGAVALVGMAGLAASLAQAPVTMALLLFELTGNYPVLLPTLITIAVSNLLLARVEQRSIYTEALAARGLAVEPRPESVVLHDLTVADVWKTEGWASLAVDAPLHEARRLFLDRRVSELYVLDHGRWVGTLLLQDSKELLADADWGADLGSLIRRDLPTLRADQELGEILPLFYRTGLDELPVLDAFGRMVGVLTEREVVGALHREMLRRGALLSRLVRTAEEADEAVALPEGQRLQVVPVPPAWSGRSLRDLALPQLYGVQVLGVDVPDGDRVRRCVASVDRPLVQGEAVVLVGQAARLEALERDLVTANPA